MGTMSTTWKDPERRDAHFIGIALLVGLLLPHSGVLYYANPALIVLLAFKYTRINRLAGVKVMILIGMSVSALGYTFFQDQYTNKELVRAAYLLMMLVLFPFAKSVRIPDFYLFFGMGFIVLSQLSWVIGFRPLIDFFVNLYPYEGDMRIYQADFLLERAPDISIVHGGLRLGGMYHNANSFSQFLGAIYAVFLIDSSRSYKFKLALSAALLVPILYAGSRTGMVVCSLLFLAYAYVQYRKVAATRKLFLAVVGIVASGFAFMVIRDLLATGGVRALDFQEGVDRSMLPKWSFFRAYIDANPGVFELFFGVFDISLVERYTRYFHIMDSEWGNAVFAYGLIFCIAIVAFYVTIYRRTRLDARLCFILLLWGVSATVLFSYRASFVFLLILSKYYVDPGRSVSEETDPPMKAEPP